MVLGGPRKRPRTPSGPPSDPPRSSPEPPSREYANGCRESTNSGLPARAPCTPCHTQPPPLIDHVLTLSHRSSRLPAPSGLPSRRTLGVGGLNGLAPTAADPERGSCGQQFENGPLRFRLRVLRRRVQPGRVMLNQDESCSRHLNQLPRNAQNSRSQARPPKLERA